MVTSPPIRVAARAMSSTTSTESLDVIDSFHDSGGVERADVQLNQLRAGEQRARSGGEVAEARADREHHVRAGGELVRRRGSRHADRTDVAGVIPGQAALAGLRFRHRQAVRFRKVAETFLGEGVLDASAHHEERLFGPLKNIRSQFQTACIRQRLADAMLAAPEELGRVVVGLGLHVLRQRERDRPAIGGVEQHAQRGGQADEDLLGPHDAVEIARDRPEAVVRRQRAVAEGLDLLEDGIGNAVGEDVARQEEERQPVDMGDRGRGDHVQRTRADRRGRGHEAAAEARLGEADRGMRHRLLVMSAEGRQAVPDAMQRLAETGDVAVAEDRPDAFDEAAAILGPLQRQPAHHGLRGGEADRGHLASPSRALSQRAQRRV